MYARCLNIWNYDLFLPVGSYAPKAVTKTAPPIFTHIIFFLCACPRSLNWTHFCKSEMFAPLASTTIPKLGKGYKIWHTNSYFKSSTSVSNQQERVLHRNLPHEPPSRTWPASASVPLQSTDTDDFNRRAQNLQPLAEASLAAISPAKWRYKVLFLLLWY